MNNHPMIVGPGRQSAMQLAMNLAIMSALSSIDMPSQSNLDRIEEERRKLRDALDDKRLRDERTKLKNEEFTNGYMVGSESQIESRMHRLTPEQWEARQKRRLRNQKKIASGAWT